MPRIPFSSPRIMKLLANVPGCIDLLEHHRLDRLSARRTADSRLARSAESVCALRALDDEQGVIGADGDPAFGGALHHRDAPLDRRQQLTSGERHAGVRREVDLARSRGLGHHVARGVERDVADPCAERAGLRVERLLPARSVDDEDRVGHDLTVHMTKPPGLSSDPGGFDWLRRHGRPRARPTQPVGRRSVEIERDHVDGVAQLLGPDSAVVGDAASRLLVASLDGLGVLLADAEVLRAARM